MSPTRTQLLEEVFAAQETCTRCPDLLANRTRVVRGRGDPDQPILAIGEGPGEDENAEGIAFVGRAGRKLDQMMTAAGLQAPAGDGSARQIYGYYVINTVACWAATMNAIRGKPENRKPTPAEYKACKPFVHKMIRIIDPACILLLGEVACRTFGLEGTVTHLQGRMVDIEVEGVHGRIRYCAMPLYHPAYILRYGDQPRLEETTVDNLRAVRQRLDMYNRVAEGLSPVAADQGLIEEEPDIDEGEE